MLIFCSFTFRPPIHLTLKSITDEELIGGVFYLTSEEAASFVNGVVIPIDGGFNAYSGV